MKIDGFKVDGIANIEHANLRTGELCVIISLAEYRCSALTIPRGAHSEYRS